MNSSKIELPRNLMIPQYLLDVSNRLFTSHYVHLFFWYLKIRLPHGVTYPVILTCQQTGFTIGQKDLYSYIPQLEPALVDFSDILIGPSHG